MSPANPPLVVRQQSPLNAETPLPLLAAPTTPLAAFYVRNHLPAPDLDPAVWHLEIDGAVAQPLRLSLAQLRALPQRTVRVTLECAGNGRAHMARPAEGTQWAYGATATAKFTGTPLRPLLDRAGVARDAVEVLFCGADRGEFEPGVAGAYERSLPLDAALSDDLLLAWAMGDEPLAAEHGAPLRLVVPGWYGMASVKWLQRISALPEPFAGYWQRERYVYVGEAGLPDGTPVTAMRVRAVITDPLAGATLSLRPTQITGSAWSGAGPIERVEVSSDDGQTWQRATLGAANSTAAAVTWQSAWQPVRLGENTLLARATDTAGNVQPMAPTWNRYGYGNNAVQRVPVTVTA